MSVEGSFAFSDIRADHRNNHHENSYQDAPPAVYDDKYVQLVDHVLPLGYVDFIPALLKPSGIISSAEYERFDSLMDRANLWLDKHPRFRVKTCESLEVKVGSDGDDIDVSKSTFYESGKINYFVRLLRIWVVGKKLHESSEPQQVGYLNVIPECLDEGGFFKEPQFENFSDTIEGLNVKLQRSPLPGAVLNIETQDMKFHKWTGNAEPDETIWRESAAVVYFLNVVRVFYEITRPAYEQIGCIDFAPCVVEQADDRDYEDLTGVVHRARRWLSREGHLNVVNAQSIDYKLSHKGWSRKEVLDTQRPLFREYGKHYTYYLRIIRVCYTKPKLEGSAPMPDRLPPPVALSYKSFIPCQLTTEGCCEIADYETMGQTMKRAMAWLKVTGAEVVSVETVPIRLHSGHQHGNPEITYTWNRGNRPENWLNVIRVYIDGVRKEPPPEQLPPVPVLVKKQDCYQCVIL